MTRMVVKWLLSEQGLVASPILIRGGVQVMVYVFVRGGLSVTFQREVSRGSEKKGVASVLILPQF